MDYRNRKFVSEDINDILDFYSSFSSKNELIKWMKERPDGVANIREVEGDKDIIVVIPTADFNGKYAKECREDIFKGLQIVFVESGNYPDPYFNYSRNMNKGFKKALEYNPKWIIFSNDDVYKIDDVYKLSQNLSSFDPNIDVVFTRASEYHSSCALLCKINLMGKLLTKLLKNGNTSRENEKILMLKKLALFRAEYWAFPCFSKLRRFLFKSILHFVNPGAFCIFNAKFLKQSNGALFDEVYINGGEDFDLGIRLNEKGIIKGTIDYNIGDYKGGTQGVNKVRVLRNHVCNGVYLDFRIKNELYAFFPPLTLENVARRGDK
jgi:hypothetical protein